MKTNRKSIYTVVVILVAVTLLFPWEHTVAPAVRVRVLDESGNPASDILVKQEWEYFSVGSSEYKEYSRTDENGYVAFPERSVRTSFLSRIMSTCLEVLSLGHYGMGAYAEISAHGSDPHVWSFVHCSVDVPAPQEIRLKRWDTAIYP